MENLQRQTELHGSVEPYDWDSISEIKCARCGRPARFQWNICSNDGRYLGICEDCDLAVNKLLLRWFRFPNWKELFDRYRKAVCG